MAIYSADLALTNRAVLSIDAAPNATIFLSDLSLVGQVNFNATTDYAAFIFKPLNHHQRLFTLHLGALDLSHSVTAVSGRISDNGVYLQATLAGFGLVDEITAGIAESLIFGVQYLNRLTGEIDYSVEFCAAVIDSVTPNKGGRSCSLNLTARAALPVIEVKTVAIENVEYYSSNQVRLMFVDDIQLGDTVQYDGQSLVVNNIAFSVSSTTSMTLTAA